MEINYTETIKFLGCTKNTGFVLVKNNSDGSCYLDSLNKFFGCFGKTLLIAGNDEYILFMFVPGKLNCLDAFSYYENNNEFLFIEGTFYDGDYHFKNTRESIDIQIAKGLFDDLKSTGNFELLKQINGHYAGVAYINHTVVAFNDSFGVNKLFYYDTNDHFIISNNLFSIINNRGLNINIDDEALAQTLTLEYPIDRLTLFKNVYCVLPSDILIKSDDKIDFLKFFLPFNRNNDRPVKSHIEELHDAFDDFFSRLKDFVDEPLNLFLSKGKDNRLFIDFLEKNHINYNLYTFIQSSGIFDFSYAIEISKLLEKDIHLLKQYDIDEVMEVISGMSTTFTSPWLALAYVINKNGYNYGLLGTTGDPLSGKLLTFREFPKIRNKQQLIAAEYDCYRKGVTSSQLNSIFHSFSKYNVKDSFFNSYETYREANLFDIEILFNIDYRCFRNTLPILNKATQLITSIHPYLDKHISRKYLSLPLPLIKSQKAHTILSARNTKSNQTRSTAFPIPLRYEPYFREIIMAAVKLNSFLKGKLLSKKLDKISTVHERSVFTPKSAYLTNLIESSQAPCLNNVLLTRLKSIDNFIKIAHENPIDKSCHAFDTIDVIGTCSSLFFFKDKYFNSNECNIRETTKPS